jgi:hypothetical protein
MPNSQNVSLSMPDLGRHTYFVVKTGENAVIRWDDPPELADDPAALKYFNETLSKLCLEARDKDADTKFKSIRDMLTRKDKEIAAAVKDAKKTANFDKVVKDWKDFVDTVNLSLERIAKDWGENFCKIVDKDLVPVALEKLAKKFKRDAVIAKVKAVVKVAAVVVIVLAAIAATVVTAGAAAGVFAITVLAVGAAKKAVDSYGRVKAASAKLTGKEVEVALEAMNNARRDAIEALESRKETIKKSYMEPLLQMRLNLEAIQREIDSREKFAANDTVKKAIAKWQVTYQIARRNMDITEEAMEAELKEVDKKISVLNALAAISPPASDLQRKVELLGKPFTDCLGFFADLRKLV